MEGQSKNRKNSGYLQPSEEKVITKGEEIIGTFNPNENPDVKTIKQSATELINKIEALGKDPRRKAIAYTQIELGTMAAIKSLFH